MARLDRWSDADIERIKLTTSCRDCDAIPKVADAGLCFGDNLEFQRMHNGVVIRRGSYHGEWMTEVIQELRGHHEPQEEKVFAEVLACMDAGASMVELGSFWAYYSMWFQRAVPDAVSIMVEPNAEKLNVGKLHFELNKMTGTFVHGFVGDHSLPSARFVDWDGREAWIPQVGVDELMAQRKMEYVDILHADIQGAEYSMLESAKLALAGRRIKYLFLSTHGCEHARCLRLIRHHGYRIIAEHSVLESVSGDGLIVAASPDLPLPPTVLISKRHVSTVERFRYSLACLKRILFG